jgi:hypothetical protein
MHRYQFSLLGSLLFVVVAAVTFAALRSVSALWPAAFVTGLVWVLAVASVAAGVTRGESRAFWAAFATFGWVHVLLAYGPGFQTFSEKLLPHEIANFLHPRLQRTITVASGSPMSGTVAAGTGMPGGTGSGGAPMGMGSAMGAMPGGPGAMGAGAGMSPYGAGMNVGSATTTMIVGPSWPHVWRISHTILTILLAIAGGILARSLYRRAHKGADQ